MNREIKFRAWDGKRMTTSGIMFNSTTGALETPEVARMKVMEYTGLKDKNGKEIYEGDIIGRTGFFSRVIKHNGVNFISYSVNNIEQEHPLTKDSIDEYDFVIGNIYENPEL